MNKQALISLITAILLASNKEDEEQYYTIEGAIKTAIEIYSKTYTMRFD